MGLFLCLLSGRDRPSLRVETMSLFFGGRRNQTPRQRALRKAVARAVRKPVQAVVKQIKKETTEETIQRLSGLGSMMEKGETRWLKKAERELAKARVLYRHNQKAAARACIKRKVMYEKKGDSLARQRANVEEMLCAVEESAMNMAVLEGTKAGAKQLKQVHGKIGGVDKIDDSIDEVREAMESHNEISNALAASFGGDEELDIDDDWEQLMEDTMQEALLATGPLPGKAETPSTTAPLVLADPVVETPVSTDEDEFAALEAELAS